MLDDVRMPGDQQVPSSLRPLLRRNAAAVRLTTLDADVDALVARLEEIATSMADSAAGKGVQTPRPPTPAPSASSEAGRTPDLDHYAEVMRLMVDEASLVVPFLGPATNSSDRDDAWYDAESGSLPDADELAAHLTRKLELADGIDLARASQYVWELRPGDLYGTLRTTLMTASPPGSVHHFLARFPAMVAKLGLGQRYQLIVTTNYDDALERAFVAAEEPFDLAVYMAVRSMRDGADATRYRGRFLHVPHEGEATVVDEPNKYLGFPFNRFTFGLERTVIVKIHGAVDTDSWRNNYVITENDYIDYLSHSTVESIVPQQIRVKLTESQFLFLGYTMRDWNLRVFLQRMFGQNLPNNSWAVQRDPSRLDGRLWKNMKVELFAVPLAQYVDELGRHLAAAGTG